MYKRRQPIGHSVSEDWEDTDFGSDIPWMAETVPEMVYTFEVKMNTIEVIVSEVPFGKTGEVKEMECEMRMIIDEEGDQLYEDGVHRVPFWACNGFRNEMKENGKKKGWTKVAYKRSESERKGKIYSAASFAKDGEE